MNSGANPTDGKANNSVTPPSLLDCSLRDGGYVNGWDFRPGFIREHVLLLDKLGVQFVEVGFRSNGLRPGPNEGFAAHSPIEFITDLKRGLSVSKIGLMVNQSDFHDSETLLERLGGRTQPGGPDFLRIATQIENLGKALTLAAVAADAVPQIFINLMQVGRLTASQIREAVLEMRKFPLAGIYIADTFGSLLPNQVSPLIEALAVAGTPHIGVHFHDNLGLALANSLVAVENGATLVDGTAIGIGRGAGNTRLEDLLLLAGIDLNLEDLAAWVEVWRNESNDFPPWGQSVEYALAAVRNVHPTYVQKLDGFEKHGLKERLEIIDLLGERGSTSFTEPIPTPGDDWFREIPAEKGAWMGALGNRNLLLIGTGTTIGTHSEEIELFIERENPDVVLVGNHSGQAFSAGTLVASFPLSFTGHSGPRNWGHKLVAPLSQMPHSVRVGLGAREVIDVPIQLSNEEFGMKDGVALIPDARSSTYAMCIASNLDDTRKIFLAGFDGYPMGDYRNEVFEDLLHRLGSSDRVVESVTPTSFKIERFSW